MTAPTDAGPARSVPGARQALLRRVRALRTAGGTLRAVRPRVWLAAGGSLALLAAALVLLPGRGAAGSAHPSTPSALPATTPPGSVAASRSATPTASSTLAVPAEPVAAARALLVERARCLTLRVTSCLSRVESAGSPVALEDAAAAAGAVEAIDVPMGRLRLRSEAGGATVLTAGDCTVLLLKDPAGWRLRDVVGPPTTRSTARTTGGGP